MNRPDVYKLIDEERDYQDSLRASGRFSNPVLPLIGELACIKTYLDEAFKIYTNNAGDEPFELRCSMRKLAAMAVRAMEHYDTPSRAEEIQRKQA